MVSAVLARMVVRQYKELFAWQTAEGFKLEVFRLVKDSELAQKDYKFRSQILEAARSVPSNITEGFRTTRWRLWARPNGGCMMASSWATSPPQPARTRLSSHDAALRRAYDSNTANDAT